MCIGEVIKRNDFINNSYSLNPQIKHNVIWSFQVQKKKKKKKNTESINPKVSKTNNRKTVI